MSAVGEADALAVRGNGARVGKRGAVTGNAKLPLARVKKIARMDEDVVAVSNAAALLIAAATEKFAAYFAEQSFFFTLAERKKGLSYRHCAAAVARLPQLDFLADVVPPPTRTQEQTNGAGGRRRAPRQREDAEDNDGAIPAWARAHPEAVAKIQAAQADRAGREASEANDEVDMDGEATTPSDKENQPEGQGTETAGGIGDISIESDSLHTRPDESYRNTNPPQTVGGDTEMYNA